MDLRGVRVVAAARGAPRIRLGTLLVVITKGMPMAWCHADPGLGREEVADELLAHGHALRRRAGPGLLTWPGSGGRTELPRESRGDAAADQMVYDTRGQLSAE